MKIKLPRRFYTIERLAERWECKVEDIEHLIETGMLDAADKGAAREGKKHIRTHVFYNWESCDWTLEHDKNVSDQLVIPIIDSADNDAPVEELIKNEMESLCDAGELEQVVSADEVSRFEREHGEPADDGPNPPTAGHELTRLTDWHSTRLLVNLEAAAERFWKNYDPDDHTTAPTNETVSAWLRSRGVASRVADIMAQILRAEGIPPGPRK